VGTPALSCPLERSSTVGTRMQSARKIIFVLGASAFCAVCATVISSIFTVGWAFIGGWKLHGLWSTLSALPIIALFAAIPAGTFGFVSGIVGGLWLLARNGRFGMLSESLFVGLFLSLLFPLFHCTMGWGGGGEFGGCALIFSAGVGCPTALLCTLWLGHPRSDQGER